MYYALLVIVMALIFAAWVCEKREGELVLRAAKRYLAERDEEYKLRCKVEREADCLREENKKLQRRNECSQDACEALANENASLYSDNAKLRSCTVVHAFSEWERKECVDIPGRVEYERDGISLIYECGKMVGWYSVDTEQTVIRTTGLESESDEEGTADCRASRSFATLEDDKTSDRVCSENDVKGQAVTEYEAPVAVVCEDATESGEKDFF